MAELVVVGPEPSQRWQRSLEPGVAASIGRSPAPGVWAVPWNSMISRLPAVEIKLVDSHLLVKCLEASRNSLRFRDELVREARLDPGEAFWIGTTSFRFVEVSSSTPAPAEVRVFADDELKTLATQDVSVQIEALAQIPQLVVDCQTDQQLAEGLVSLLLKTVTRADAVAVVSPQVPGESTESDEWRLVHWDSRAGNVASFVPSRRLIASALKNGQSVLHIWGESVEEEGFTLPDTHDWAFATPFQHGSLRGWCLYVSGFSSTKITMPQVLEKGGFSRDLRFTELLAQFFGATRQVRALEDFQTGLSRFFPPKIIQLLSEADIDSVLKPRESEIGVLFCDLRGFSRASEQQHAELGELLERVSAALEVMTRRIMEYDGVVSDFQGDSALGFWGWPTMPESGPLAACRAALAIQREFQERSAEIGSSLHGFRVGVGVAWGNAIAGRIGPEQIIKVGVFGPVVNLCARLEGMTKMMRVPILIDEVTARSVREELSSDEGRCRRLCCVQPAGMDQPLTVSELLPPESEETLSNEHIAIYEQALDAFLAGDWHQSLDLLGELPVRDRGKDFLMIHIAQHHYEPPPNWSGVVSLTSK
jgi:adenylate cyclase